YPQVPPPHPLPTNPSPKAKAAAADNPVIAEMSEQELRARLVGRPLFLRGLWLDESLHFNMDGDLVGQSPKGSFTLCGVLIDHIHVTKKTVEMEGIRYGIHFEDEAQWKDQATSFDRLQITPKKKHQVIVIDRLVVVPPKKEGGKGLLGMLRRGGSEEPGTGTESQNQGKAASTTVAGASGQGNGTASADDGKTTTSPAESAERLRNALNRIFAPELDAKMVAAMPDYWQFFYQAQQAHKSLVPTDPDIVRPGPGVESPKLVKNIVPESNDYAQRDQVAGVASYKVILGKDGKPLAVAVYRPIGFGLDETAVTAIQKSTFTPAEKDGKPVESVIDLAVQFRIYSPLTSKPAPLDTAAGGTLDQDIRNLHLPGPFTAAEEKQEAAAGPPASGTTKQ
ncbi:MAG: energy transducer TonB, partial [Acidobacteriaceae bacterium]